ncbi:hypothetical protein BT63DRAFT_424860 [Microthyrium microscopicum]|uniref:Uncharacterized protein n=1 Tax=Microthyrium microscopicum TaxID=703497 RepID=A0A6A6UA58_9PEZI|nr:hypothetical protein BT63DRAFT_424860 [Microthyrium microscopicum]
MRFRTQPKFNGFIFPKTTLVNSYARQEDEEDEEHSSPNFCASCEVPTSTEEYYCSYACRNADLENSVLSTSE